MNNRSRLIKTGVFLILLSVLLHGLHYLIFKDIKHIFVYLLGDIAFIPLEVFIVTLVIDQLLEKREKLERVKKLNMLVGLFYQEIGLALLKTFAKTDPQIDSLKKTCKFNADWTAMQFKDAEKMLLSLDKKVQIDRIDLGDLKSLLSENKNLLINLIANPALLEHETFSELLMAVSHLLEELQLREKVQAKYPTYDNSDHIAIDIERVYSHLLIQWLHYIEHLKTDYPFLYATAVTTNPLESRV